MTTIDLVASGATDRHKPHPGSVPFAAQARRQRVLRTQPPGNLSPGAEAQNRLSPGPSKTPAIKKLGEVSGVILMITRVARTGIDLMAFRFSWIQRGGGCSLVAVCPVITRNPL